MAWCHGGTLKDLYLYLYPQDSQTKEKVSEQKQNRTDKKKSVRS